MKLMIVIIVLVAVGWELFWYALGVTPLLPWQLKRRQAEDPGSLLFLDVRTGPEYHWFHIPDASHRQDLLFQPEQFTHPAPRKNVVVICMTGHRSPVAAWRLKKQGIHPIYHLTGGMLGWKLFGGPVRSGKGR